VLKLALPWATAERVDGVMGGWMVRALDGRERPVQGFTRLRGGAGALGVVCPDVFGLDADAHGARLTLLRSPLMAHHDPAPAEAFPRAMIADQGVHAFRFEFAAADGATPAWLARRASMARRPPAIGELTRGMGERGDW